MIGKLFSFLDSNTKQVTRTDESLTKIKQWREKTPSLSYEDIQKRVREMREEIKALVDKIPQDQRLSLRKIDRTQGLPQNEKDIQAKLFEFMPEIYAYADEVFSRKMGFRYHDVQLRAAIILAQGQRLVELYTGEGKTMTFQLPLLLHSLVGRGAHLVTVNDYLSRRDGEYAGHIATSLGLSVGIINSQVSYKFVSDSEAKTYKGEEFNVDENRVIVVSQMDGGNLIEVSKQDAYNADITYGTNNEFGFDYLRDNMAWDLTQLSQRELYFCIIDEADSILIDEARTPLIISGVPSDADSDKYIKFATAVNNLEENTHYEIDHKTRSVTLTEDGIKFVEGNLGIDNLWKDYSAAYHIENALKAKTMFNRDEHYLVKSGEVLIVDEFTGRILKGRRYSEGLHQAIEAKEGVKIQQESRTFATITFQNFFRLYKVLSGGSGTVMTEAEEFYKIYGLETIAIPTNRPVVRADHADRIYKNQDAKFKAVVNEVKELHEKGQPVLIGTTSVEKSEIVSQLLDKNGIAHEVLNAKYHEQEAKIIERAGRKGAVTVATNMAGRGADIIIGGGRRGDDAWKEIAELGGLHVIGTERHEARRIDNQLRGRTGRQGEPGSSRFYVALDDTLMKILGGDLMGRLMGMVGLEDDMPIEIGFISRQIETAQKRIENLNFDSRKRVVDYDDVMNQHREIFYSRRRNFLNFVEGASGRFAHQSGVIDINLPQFSEYKTQYENEVANQKSKVKEIVTGIYENYLNNFVNTVFERNNNEIKKIVAEYIQVVPERLIRKVVDTINTEEYFAKFDAKTVRAEFVRVGVDSFKLKLEEFGEDFYYLSKVLMLQNTDNLWVDHLELMKDIRDGIGLKAYAQRDPLVEYKNEAFGIFESFVVKINSEVARKILNIEKVDAPAATATRSLNTNVEDVKDVSTGSREFIQDAEITSDVDDTLSADQAKAARKLIEKGLKERKIQEASLTTNSSSGQNQKLVSKEKIVGRNDKVSVRYQDGTVLKDVKFKKVEDDVRNGKAKLI